MDCPVDGDTLVMSERQGIEIDYCPRCRGVWLDRGELDKVIERSSTELEERGRDRDRGDGRGEREYERAREGRDRDDDRERSGGVFGRLRGDDDDDRDRGRKKSRRSFLGDLFEGGD